MLSEGMRQAGDGERIIVSATDPGFISDAKIWCERTGHTLEEITEKDDVYKVKIIKGAAVLKDLPATGNDKSLILFSGDLDKAIATLIIANGAAGMERQVTIFFTFWGLNVLRRNHKVKVKKGVLERMFGWMMPRGSQKLGLSRLNMAGLGGKMIRHVMQTKNVSSLEELLATPLASRVRLVGSEMSMHVMGIKEEELLEGVEIGGVATFLGAAELSDTNLFI